VESWSRNKRTKVVIVIYDGKKCQNHFIYVLYVLHVKFYIKWYLVLIRCVTHIQNIVMIKYKLRLKEKSKNFQNMN